MTDVLFHDEFRDGFPDGFRGGLHDGLHDGLRAGLRAGSGPGPGWQARGDGVATVSADGLLVRSAGTDPVTGAPAFTATCDPAAPGGGRGDHLKWTALVRHTAGSGLPGFDVPDGGALTVGAVLTARFPGTGRHPFGAAVADPASDLRLAAAGLVAFDPASRAAFDFLLTDTRVYALYERLPEPAGSGAPRPAAFSQAVPVAVRTPESWHRCAVRVDRGGTRVTWLLDGAEVFAVDRIGHRPAGREHLLLDHGGEPGEPVRLGQLAVGLATMTLLDGAGPDGRGLVRLDAAPGHYYDVRSGAPAPQAFVDERSRPESRLFGAGAVLRVREVTVREAREVREVPAVRVRTGVDSRRRPR
ncbi:DUF6081 family protein [Kitasatospora sp. NPDC058201]|uniref:DUF6081 family protein n=1 Tax=unclassified Kitasatospora TaxID=2633591 RepID=UPI00364EDD24